MYHNARPNSCIKELPMNVVVMCDFKFEEEMVYGKKHISTISYKTEDYDFRPYLRKCFSVSELSEIHNYGPSYQLHTKFGDDVQTWYHKTFYTYLDSPNGKPMKDMYFNLVEKVILPYLGLDQALVQKFPSFRIQLPGNIAVARAHTDHELGHPIGEVNFTYAFTKMYDTNTIYIEKMPRLEQYLPIESDANSVTCFNGNLCNHYNEINTTGKTRISMDFRILPLNYAGNATGHSLSYGKSFTDGEYYVNVKRHL